MTHENHPGWSADALLALGRSYQPAAVLAAAAELDLFGALEPKPLTAAELAGNIRCDRRGLTILLDALAALQLLHKEGQLYSLPPGLAAWLTSGGTQTVLGISQHQANCLRNWTQLARVVRAGRPAERTPSVRGSSADQEAFIRAMDNLAAPVADQIIRAIEPLQFRHLLDIGGASGTWTIAFLRALPTASATLFDLPPVIPTAERRLTTAGLRPRVRLVAGDFMVDPLPDGTDLAWLSAIVHQNSRAQNRTLFAKILGALVPEGRLVIRDVLMEATRTRPLAGALFAVNMLVATEGGGTFTFEELRDDLASVGFVDATVARQDEGMHSLVVARKPGI